MGYLNEGGRTPDWKMRATLIGSALGAVAARLFIRSDAIALEHDRQRGPQGIGFSPSLMIPLLITLLGLLREIGGLAGEKAEK